MTNTPFSNELFALLQKAPKAFNSRPINSAYDSLIGLTQSTGQQLANNAGNEYFGRALQSGASTLGSGVASAQAFLPFLQQGAQLKAEQVQKVSDTKQAGFSAQAQIASQLASLRQNYANFLANQNSQNRQLDITEGNLNLARLTADRNWALQQPMQRDVFNVGGFAANPVVSTQRRLFAF